MNDSHCSYFIAPNQSVSTEFSDGNTIDTEHFFFTLCPIIHANPYLDKFED